MDNPNNWQASLAERAYCLIRNGILQGQFPMGAPLSRRKLALQFGMSSLPISDAIRRLQDEGLVESRPRVGTRVRIPTPQEVRDFYIIREALETQSARLFAEKASSGERRELRKMATQLDANMEQCQNRDVAPDIIYRVYAFHTSFHMRIAECTGSPALRDAIEKKHVLIFNWLFDITAESNFTPPHFHGDLIEVVAGHDPEAADAAMRRHVRNGLEETLAAMTSRLTPHISRVKHSEAGDPLAPLYSAAGSSWRS
jgi:DNA-binding GntR family transcriptional regulator